MNRLEDYAKTQINPSLFIRKGDRNPVFVFVGILVAVLMAFYVTATWNKPKPPPVTAPTPVELNIEKRKHFSAGIASGIDIGLAVGRGQITNQMQLNAASTALVNAYAPEK